MSPCTSERKGAAQGLHYIVEFADILLGTPVLVMVEKNSRAISCCVALGSGSGLYQNRDGRGAWWPAL